MSARNIASMLENMNLVELSHMLEPNIPGWLTQARYMQVNYKSLRLGDDSSHNMFGMGEHTATHIDMPGHFVGEGPGELYLQDIPAETYLGLCKTLDFSATCTPGYAITLADVQEWEKAHGPIESGDIVLFCTGWSRYWAVKPNDKQYASKWPCLATDVAEYLVAKRVKIVGLDAMSVDGTQNVSPNHNILLGNRVLIIENLTNLSHLSPESYFIGLPLNMKNGTGCPIRAIAYT